jgi:hypothetical protein
MLLSFKKQFIEPINNGLKVHTIREDKHRRFEPGREIQFGANVRTKSYFQFYSATCESIQRIIIWPATRRVFVLNDGGHELDEHDINRLAENDGFATVEDFWKWFNGPVFIGFIIGWDKATIYPYDNRDDYYDYECCVEPEMLSRCPDRMNLLKFIMNRYPDFEI